MKDKSVIIDMVEVEEGHFVPAGEASSREGDPRQSWLARTLKAGEAAFLLNLKKE